MDRSLTLMIVAIHTGYSFYVVMGHVFIIIIFLDSYTLYFNDTLIKTIYIHFESIFTSIITMCIHVLRSFTVIMMECNKSDYQSYFKFICHDYLSLIYSIMIYLSNISSKSIFYDIFEWIKQYLDDVNDNFDGIKSENDGKYRFNTNIHCVAFDCILMFIMTVLCAIYFVYQLRNHLLFQEIAVFYYFMQIMPCSIILHHYYNQRMKFYWFINLLEQHLQD